MNNQTKKWLRGGIEILIHGACAAGIATMTSWFIDPHDWAPGTHNFWKMFGASFATQGGIRFLQWLMANPLPPDGIDSVTVNLNPLKPTTENQTPKGTQ